MYIFTKYFKIYHARH